MITRPFADTDRAFAADLIAAEWPHRAGEAIPLREGDNLPNAPRWTAADPGSDEPRAYASLWRVAGDRFRMDLVVAPGWRRRGIGNRMLDTIVEAATSAGAATLQARTYASDAESLRFLERRSFAETMRMQGMRLDVREVDPERLVACERRAAAQGFAITTLAEAQRSDAECWRKLWKLNGEAQEGWADPDPRPGPRRPMSFDAFLARSAELPPDPEAFFIIQKGGRYAGFTGSLGTAVHPDFRGLGLANALKVRAALHARATGVEVLETSTGSAAMQRANENVGYRVTYSEVRLVRRITSAG
ncbi:MAG: GNAT family N-acetyltransferase [Longimicrobiaceae bacterium]